jgi:hypothetical protein
MSHCPALRWGNVTFPRGLAGQCDIALVRGWGVERSGSYARAVQKWEYVTVPLLVHATKQILDTWGIDGWELIQVVPAPGGGDQLVAYMKRPLP